MADTSEDVPPEDTVQVSLPDDHKAPGQARQVVRSALTRWRLPALVDACVLTASELVTNAFRHGRPPVSMSMRHRAQRLRLDVHDGDPRPVDDASVSHEADDEGGRGLSLVHALADEVGSEPQPGDGKSVYAEWRTDPR